MALTQVPSGMIASTAQYTGFKNRFINACMRVAQRATSATVTAGTTVPTSSTGYPCVDRWFVYSTGANVTAAQVAGSSTTQNRLQITGAASVTAVGVGQRIEANNSYDLNGQTVTLSVDMANSVLTSVTWTANYATTANTFGTIGTPTKTQIATGTFTINSTVTQYAVQIAIPAAATTGIEILFTVGAQTSGTWTIGNPQIELGASATAFDARPIGTEFLLCQRYYQTTIDNGSSSVLWIRCGNESGATYFEWIPFNGARMRSSPTVSLANTGYGSGSSGGISQAKPHGVLINFLPSGANGYMTTDYLAASEL